MKYTETEFRKLEHEMIEFIKEHHGDQTYGSDKPYVYHLKAVRDAAFEYLPYLPYGVSIQILALGCWGHDLIEDPKVKREEIAKRFGEEVAEVIYLVSDIGPGKTRKDRAPEYYARVRSKVISTVLKVLDRIVNVRNGGKIDMYRKEHPTFKSALYKAGEIDKLWEDLDRMLEVVE